MSTPLRLHELAALGPRSQKEIVLDLDASQIVEPQHWFETLQEALRPGGHATLIGEGVRAGSRGLESAARQYFDVTRPARHELRLTRRSTGSATTHFESLAATYWNQIPAHVQDHFFRKKLEILKAHVPRRNDLVGLDLGCGVGRYAAAARADLGGRVVGLDPVRNGLSEAQRHSPGPQYVAGDVLRLPFRGGRFDYAYTINVLHHLKRGEQERGLRELRRVLRPDGVLVVHEMNIRNPLFHWYLRHVYPRLRPIDRGDEEFIDPRRWPLTDGWGLESLHHMGFVPDFTPRRLLSPMRQLEAWLEKGRARAYSVHYAVVLRPR